MGRIGPGMAEYCFRTCSGIYREAGIGRGRRPGIFFGIFFLEVK
ncbi:MULTISPECIES: hypothetical protein [Clostridia]|nr:MULTISPECIES: hypothetical protein [Clostridia]